MYRLLALSVVLGAFYHLNLYRTSNILDKADHILLISSHLLLISVLTGGWMMQLAYNVLLGVQVSILIVICSYSRLHGSGHQLKFYMIGVGYVGIWIALKCYVSKVWLYGIGQPIPELQANFDGVLGDLLGGWNCKFLEFTTIPTIWLACYLFAYFTGRNIIKKEEDLDHSWKQEIMNRKILPDIVCVSGLVIFNLIAYWSADGVKQCCIFWNGRTSTQRILIDLVKALIYVASPVSTYWFYYKMVPEFQRKDPDQGLTETLNQ